MAWVANWLTALLDKKCDPDKVREVSADGGRNSLIQFPEAENYHFRLGNVPRRRTSSRTETDWEKP